MIKFRTINLTNIIFIIGFGFIIKSPTYSQFGCLDDNFTFKLTGSGSNSKSGQGANYVQHMDFSLEVDFEFQAYNPVQTGNDIVKYSIIAPGTNTIQFEYVATDTVWDATGISTLFDDYEGSFSYTASPFVGELEYSIYENKIINLYFPIIPPPVFVDSPTPYSIIYSESLNDSLRVLIAMDYPWYYLNDPNYYDINGENDVEKRVTLEMYTQNRFLDEPKLLVTAKKDEDNPYGKICADGSEETTLLKLYCAEEEDIKILIKEDPDADKPDIYGTIQEHPSEDNAFYYKHPDNVLDDSGDPISYPNKIIHIQIRDKESDELLLELPIRVYRAPVVMVHGLWADSGAFKDIEQNLTDVFNMWTDQLTFKADYKSTNADHFATNSNEVFESIRTMVTFANLKDFSVSRVNLIAHSMGGLLSRMFIQSDKFSNDICRFITINTPHSGTQNANFLRSNQCLGFKFSLIKRPIDKGAVDDLHVCSLALWGEGTGLNDSHNLNKNIVPSHAIVTTDYPPIEDIVGKIMLLMVKSCVGEEAFDFMSI